MTTLSTRSGTRRRAPARDGHARLDALTRARACGDAAYSPLVTKDCYLVVFDTVVEQMPADAFSGSALGEG